MCPFGFYGFPVGFCGFPGGSPHLPHPGGWQQQCVSSRHGSDVQRMGLGLDPAEAPCLAQGPLVPQLLKRGFPKGTERGTEEAQTPDHSVDPKQEAGRMESWASPSPA